MMWFRLVTLVWIAGFLILTIYQINRRQFGWVGLNILILIMSTWSYVESAIDTARQPPIKPDKERGE